MNSLLPLLFGSLLIAGGVLGKRFVVGLSGKVKASPWYGRTWMIGSGLLLIGGAVSGLMKEAHAHNSLFTDERFWGRTQCVFEASFETYNSLVVAVVGLLLSVYYLRNGNWRWFWLGVAFIAGGSIFGYDGVWSLLKGCPQSVR